MIKKNEAKKMLQAYLNCLEKRTAPFTEGGCRNDEECEECRYCYEQGTYNERREALKIAIEALSLTQPKVNEWIPVSDGLPEGCDDAEIELLISTHEAYPEVLFEETGFALYYPETKTFHSVYGNGLDITEVVTAWKHLPEPYMRNKVTE